VTKEIKWLDAQAPWNVPLLDIRPTTQETLLSSTNPQCAINAISFGTEDGTTFIGTAPSSQRTTKSRLTYPIQRILADGVLFIPRVMEHKWALFYHRAQIICVRSWTREVAAVADVQQHANHVEVVSIRGTITGEKDSEFTIRLFDFLIRTHALNIDFPVPLKPYLIADPKGAAMWCLSNFGNRAAFATQHKISVEPVSPLRTHSLFHIAIARGNIEEAAKWLRSGVPIDLLAADGLSALHWAVARPDTTMMDFLLTQGSPVDVLSDELATPLMNAVQKGDIPQVNFLLEHRADVNAKDIRGVTSLHRAVDYGTAQMVKILLDRGADPKFPYNGLTPREIATRRGALEIAKLF
jgi:hypothetical protein